MRSSSEGCLNPLESFRRVEDDETLVVGSSVFSDLLGIDDVAETGLLSIGDEGLQGVGIRRGPIINGEAPATALIRRHDGENYGTGTEVGGVILYRPPVPLRSAHFFYADLT